MTKTELFKFAEVGGAVRDSFLNVESKDVDFTAIPLTQFNTIEDAFESLVEHLKQENFDIFLTTPEFLTVRAQVPKGSPLKERTDVADFVLARKEGPYSDGRHPDWVIPGTLFDDLERRDFTVNAMAILDGEFIDPFNGKSDLENGILRFVGDPVQRIQEDGLRVIRALRFSVTKDLVMNGETFEVINSPDAIKSLSNVSNDRIVSELTKMFTKSTVDSINLISRLNEDLQQVIFNDGVWLMPTLKKRRRQKKLTHDTTTYEPTSL